MIKASFRRTGRASSRKNTHNEPAASGKLSDPALAYPASHAAGGGHGNPQKDVHWFLQWIQTTWMPCGASLSRQRPCITPPACQPVKGTASPAKRHHAMAGDWGNSGSSGQTQQRRPSVQRHQPAARQMLRAALQSAPPLGPVQVPHSSLCPVWLATCIQLSRPDRGMAHQLTWPFAAQARCCHLMTRPQNVVTVVPGIRGPLPPSCQLSPATAMAAGMGKCQAVMAPVRWGSTCSHATRRAQPTPRSSCHQDAARQGACQAIVMRPLVQHLHKSSQGQRLTTVKCPSSPSKRWVMGSSCVPAAATDY
jgi:hypothetical protein